MAPFTFTSGGGGGGAGPSKDDFTTIDLTDGSWTLNDPDSIVQSGPTKSGDKISVEVDTTSNTGYLTGAVWYKELKAQDGTSDFDFTDAPADLRFFLSWPDSGWQDSGGGSGGIGNPAVGSRTYCILGVMTDPENLPTVGSATPVPRDVLGAGLEWQPNVTRLYRAAVRNVSESGTHGSLDTNKAGLDSISAADVAAGHRACNRLEWSTNITKAEHLAAGNLSPAGSPRCYYMIWGDRYDNGDLRTIGSYAASQRWGRTRTDKLYVFVAIGRGSSGASSNSTVAFNGYYSATLHDSGCNPSGKTSLPA